MAGAIPVAALDMWGLATETYHLNFPNANIYCMKASSLSPKDVIEDTGQIDLLLASPECTNHSIARGNKPHCERSRATAFEVVRFAKILRPRWFIMENVIQMQRWHRFDEWHRKIKAIGYKTSIGVLDSQYYGTPQARRRLFVVGDLEKSPHLPKNGSRTQKTVASILGRGESKRNPWILSTVDVPTRAKATIRRAEHAINELGNNSPFIMVYYSTDGAGGFQTLDRPLRTVTTVDRFAFVKLNGTGYEMMMLQPPELAAAMGFPDYHKWAESTRRERIKLIGNAVCPLVMQAVVKSLTSD
jgi:DNA (cytosine-5)-methyltransferase 1